MAFPVPRVDRLSRGAGDEEVGDSQEGEYDQDAEDAQDDPATGLILRRRRTRHDGARGHCLFLSWGWTGAGPGGLFGGWFCLQPQLVKKLFRPAQMAAMSSSTKAMPRMAVRATPPRTPPTARALGSLLRNSSTTPATTMARKTMPPTKIVIPSGLAVISSPPPRAKKMTAPATIRPPSTPSTTQLAVRSCLTS